LSDLAGTLRNEIRRLARKEANASTQPLRKLVAGLRRRVARHRKQIRELEMEQKRVRASARVQGAAERTPDSAIRFSAVWVRNHRAKLKMSRRLYAKLIGVSMQTIVGWESGKSRPRRQALESWSRIRKMGARELKALAVAPEPRRPRRGKRRAVAKRGRVRTKRAKRT
jgi:DNA-binding transcriptional regulator YiaG